jgi:DNA-binding NtrC family response regulator
MTVNIYRTEPRWDETRRESWDCATAPSNARCEVLIIDENAFSRILTALYLEKLGWTARMASDPVAGLEIFRESRTKIAAVVIDFHAAQRDEAALLHALSELRRDLPIILCGGSSVDKMRGISPTAPTTVDCLVRPFSCAELENAMRRASLHAAVPWPPAPLWPASA